MLKKILTWIEDRNPAPTSFLKQDKKYRINALTLRFKDLGVRERFYQFIQPYDLHAIRSAAITGAAVYMLFTIIDYLINDIVFTQTMIIRIAVVGPCSILALVLTFYSPFKDNNKYLQFLSVLIVTIGQAGHFAIGLINEIQPFYLLVTSILLTIFANTLMCIRFSIATLLNITYFIIFQIIHVIQGTAYIGGR